MAVALGWAVAVAAVGAIVSLFSGEELVGGRSVWGPVGVHRWLPLAAATRRPPASAVWCSAAAAAAGNLNFAPGACERLEPYLSSHIVGQELALRQISDAVCDHLAQAEPQRPLVLSLHGPPGVGKSMFHLLAARALYNRKVHAELRCPGLDCAGYKVRACGWRVGAPAAAGWTPV